MGMRFSQWFLALVAVLVSLSGTGVFAANEDRPLAAAPGGALAAALLGSDQPVQPIREDGPVPGWRIMADGATIGYIASTWEIARSTGYSGRPIDVLVAITPEARIAGARLMRHNEPILTLGLSEADITRYVSGFAGVDLRAARPDLLAQSGDLPDVISRATVSTGVIRDAILRTARTLAIGRGLVDGGGGIDRVAFVEKTWDQLAGEGALGHVRVTLSAAHAALLAGKNPPPEGDGAFLDLWAALLDPPTIGRNLLGQQDFSRAIGALGPGETALFLASRGLQSPRGTAWRRSGVFDRLALVQGDTRLVFSATDYIRIDELAAAGAPDFRERSVFRLPAKDFDPTKPFRIEVLASRPAKTPGAAPAKMLITLDYALPAAYLTPPAPEPEPMWKSMWQKKRASAIGTVAMLVVLTLGLLFLESFVRNPAVWRWGRIGFLSVTLVWLGWGINGQLSVVQVVAFVQSLLTGFHWETFLIEPVIFLLWSFVALGLLFWGRGVYCGWLCPFGALQELTNIVAQRFKIPQIAVPQALHERLWAIKYTLFVIILALSFYSMERALVLAEAEPFKTAISMRMMRAWPFVAFVGVLLVAGLFIERFYCRYLCPLGAALAIPAKLKIFDWLHRRPQCGRECHLCEQKCTVGAIDPLGRINPNECVLCLRCQVIFHDKSTCVVLKRRARATPQTGATP